MPTRMKAAVWTMSSALILSCASSTLHAQNPLEDLLGENGLLGGITAPLGEITNPIITGVDQTLDPVTDVLDEALLEAVLDGAEPLVDPLLDALDPLTGGVLDPAVEDLTGGSLTGALDSDQGDGLVNDLLGPSDPELGAEGPLSPLTAPLGDITNPVVEGVDQILNPVTDAVDDTLLEVVLDGAAPLVDPLTDGLDPVLSVADPAVEDLTGGNLSDALTNNDQNTADGNGVVNDLLGGEGQGAEAPLSPITSPLGEITNPIVDVLDGALDPLTDPVVDGAVGTPLLGGLDPVTGTLTDALTEGLPVLPVVDPVVGDLTGGNVSDALTNNDRFNPDDGDGLVNDLLGGGNGDDGSGDGDGDGDNGDNPGLSKLENGAAQDCADGDGDGVCDAPDQCRDTPLGKAVLPNGCHLELAKPLRLDGVLFEFDSARLTPASVQVLDAAVAVIRQAGAAVEVAGHTDARGDDDYNLALSERRANAVRDYLIAHGIEAEVLSAQGYGESQAVADNDSDQGRAANRRVELRLSK